MRRLHQISWRRAGVVGLAGVLVASCLGVQAKVTLVSPARPPLMGGYCPVQVFPKARPWYAFTDLATIQVLCDTPDLCVDEMRHQACLVGGDTVYGFIQQPGFNRVSATLAVRTETVAGVPPSEAGWVADPSCSPICSPGYVCLEGRCIPPCSPACAANETCTPARICTPKTPASRLDRGER
jgi:hypothetical protein